MSTIVETIIKNRISDDDLEYYYGDIDNLLNYKYDLITDLNTIRDMDKASDIINTTIENKGLIVIIGDIDQDGILGSYCIYTSLIDYMCSGKDNVKLIIGTRKEGRGINRYVLDKLYKLVNLLKREPALIITVDHGSTDEPSYREIKSKFKNTKLIVTDHHTVEYDRYPKSADAFINVHRRDNEYDKHISGCVTGFLVMYYTYYKYCNADMSIFNHILPYAGLSTIGDVMSMKAPINRYLVNEAIRLLNNTEDLDDNFVSFKDILKLQPTITYKDFGMSIAPFINTGNRMGCEEYALLSLVIEDINKKHELMDYIARLNKVRKDTTREITQQVMFSPEVTNYNYGNVVSINSNAMIAGPVAGNLSGLLKRPIICVGGVDRDVYNGSGRCDVPGVSILEILREIQEENEGVIKQANGHKGACGVTIYGDKLDVFRDLFNKKSEEMLKDIVIEPVEAEMILEHKDINMYTYGQVMKVSPYGLNWEEPIFRSNGLKVISMFKIKTFYKITFQLDDGYIIEGMYFFRHISKIGLNHLNLKDMIKEKSYVDVLYNISTNYYNSRYSIQLEIVDIRPQGG